MNKKFFKCKRLVICAQEPDNLQKTLTMLIEERYKDEDTGSDGVNSLPKLELSYSAGVCFFLLKQAKRTIINLKIKNLPLNLKKNPKNDFRSSIFHLSTIIILIISRMTWWKIAFSARLSSTLIFHLPPTVSGGKSSVKN